MVSPGTDVESRTRDIGRELFAAARRLERSASTEAWRDRLMMRWGMRDERLKAQLFRFVDVLPVLASSQQVNGHLREYLSTVSDRLPPGAGRALRWLPDDGWLGRRVAELARTNARRMARRFIAATDLSEAVAAVKAMRARNLAFTVDLLGEAVLSAREAERYQGEYLRLIDGLSQASAYWPVADSIDRDESGNVIPPVNVSVKLSSLFSQFDPIDPAGTSEMVRSRLRPILRMAKERGAFVNIDMEQYAYKGVTLRIFKEVFAEEEFREWGDVGIAIQAYLKDCGDDLADLAKWAGQRGTPVWVRLVKGAYWDYETVVAAQNNWPVPVFADKPATDANFEAQTRFLIERRDVLRPAIASHNIRSIAHAIALAEAYGLKPRGYEFQMLYGMADPIKAALTELGHRVRVYTPYGQLLPGMAYLVRRLLENTSNESFLRAGFLEHLPEEQLLMNPLEILRRKRSNGSASGNGHPESRSATPERDVHHFCNEPLTDFSKDEPRERMRQAIESVRAQSRDAKFPLVIAGRRLETGRTIESLNPSMLSHVVGRCASARVEDAQAAVAAAKGAFPAWRDTPANERAGLLSRAADVMRRRRFELAAWEVFETAKQWREADADVAEAIDFCEYYGRQMLRLAEPRRCDVPGEENSTVYEGRGVAVVIAPWNFPLAILCGMTAAALVAGNTVVMKPAEQSPVMGAKLMEVFEEAGVPRGVLNFLPGVGEEIGPTLVNHPDVSLIAFTGSRPVGLSIQKQAAETPAGQDHIKRVITELGGKNAVIVDEDADLDEAVHGVVASAFGYAGQKCSACSRAVVLAPVYAAFVSRLVEATRSLKVGPAEDPGYSVGPVIDEDARRRILDYVEKGKREARLAYAADVGDLARQGTFVGPHVFADVPPTAAIAQEEIFGPVLAVIKAADLDDALRIANGTKYALTGGVYSRSPANIETVRREFRVGNLYINRKITGALVDRQPFGGFKLSGTGPKAGGPDYLPQFMIARTVTENTLRRGFAPVSVEAAQPATAGE